ncbi:MAG TPA: 16S rRNA (guanine(527)-N(7))-methyltransferase RsmG [Chitinophagaceae bacterium]|jgi:16S rRNA (guanine527-N7)-methyltransferase|nr:16S rRNA (guanine(527)-N(7))-methyltransferase RsmG [Chitinophagaceae bacterium]
MQIILKYFSDFTPAQLEQFAALDPLYKEWNSKINVISRKDIDGLYEKHVLHSLAIAAAFQFEPGMEILDIGTGGGFPGIPLAIFFPKVKFFLADSITKKLKVVDAVAEALELKNVTTQHTRVEEIKNRKFDFVASRAVAPLKELWRWSKPLLKKSREPGVQSREPETNYELRTKNSELLSPGLICLKGGDLTTEIHDSGTRPRVMEISDIFDEEYFKTKYLLFVPR